MPRRKRALSAPSLALEKKTLKLLLAFSFLILSVLIAGSLITNAGVLLSLRESFYVIFGIGIVFIPVFGLILSLLFFSLKFRFTKPNFILGSLLAFLSLLALTGPFSKSFSGSIGSSLWSLVKTTLTPPGGFFVLLVALIVSVIITASSNREEAVVNLTRLSKILSFFAKKFKNFFFGGKKPRFNPPKAAVIERGNERFQPPSELPGLGAKVVSNAPKNNRIWEYPPLSLLSDIKSGSANRGNTKHNASVIEKTLEAFGIVAKVVEVNYGPTVTQYALQIPIGTKLSKILGLQNDLALALATTTGNVRIEAPIPGKSLVGIEIPNISPEIVSLKGILSSDAIRSTKSKTAVGLGLDVSGNITITDIAKMPHVLIAGTTGSGKSVLLNAMIATMLFRASPQEVKFIMADPKRVELTEYNDVPHLLTPVIVDPEKILSALKWAEKEMEKRYRMFNEAKVKNIAAYNEYLGYQAIPYIIIVIDELYNIMDFAPLEVEASICRLAAMARATGIHLVLSTQRPSVDVITGTIKANIACRIAFNVSSMIDSRVIIDQPGADKLLGRGDMLYLPPEASKPQRLQGVYASSTDIRNLINFLKRSGIEPEYTEEVTQMPVGKVTGEGGEKDDLFEEAVRTICQYDRASASLLQRRLHVGYARAARLIDQMEMAGIIGPGDGSKPRDVLFKNPDDYFAQVEKQQASQNE